MLDKFLLAYRRLRYRDGATLSGFIAHDVKREIRIISTARLAEGIVVAQVRTRNLLYESHGLAAESEFEPATEIAIRDLWRWTGKPWGGLADGTSFADHLHERDPLRHPTEHQHRAGG